jgi:hypothetical protein
MVSIFTLDESLTECGAHQDCGPQLVGEFVQPAAWSTPRPTLDPEKSLKLSALKENWLYRDI